MTQQEPPVESVAAEGANTGAGGQSTAKENDLRPWFKKKRFVIPIAAVVLFGGIGAATGGGSDDADVTAVVEPSEPAVVTPVEEEPVEEEPAEQEAAPEEPAADEGTVAQQNALRSAESYLSFSAFSRTGLIGQLEFEGYSTEDATWAVDRVEVDWMEQAAKSAESYLQVSAFSRSGLIDQLVFEGFTREEAEYGVTQVGL